MKKGETLSERLVRERVIVSWMDNWLSEMDRIKKSHKDESIWITNDEAVTMLMEAENILEKFRQKETTPKK